MFAGLGLVCGGVAAYFASSLGGVAVVKFLNYRFCFSSWLLLALISRSTWLLALPMRHALQRWEGASVGVTARQLRIYILIAVGLSTVEVLNSVSVSILPGSLYALLKGSDVGWSMVLSRIVLKKTYNGWQVVAAVLIMLGVAAVFALGPPSPAEAHAAAAEAASRAANVDAPLAAGLCVLGAFVNALCSVVTEATLKTTLKEEEERLLLASEKVPSKLLLSTTYSMWTTLFSFGILASFAVLGDQLAHVSLMDASCESSASSEDWCTEEYLVLLFLALVMLARFAERLSKHWICVHDSAMTFSLVQAARRLSGVFILALAFGERLPLSMVAGSLATGGGFVLHWYGSLPPTDSGDKRDYELVSRSASSAEEDEIENGANSAKEAADAHRHRHER